MKEIQEKIANEKKAKKGLADFYSGQMRKRPKKRSSYNITRNIGY
tara:strand:- start:1262 stop:1396 length:135 start_codon:yes stop_codon:yes gene_type:complete